MPLLNKLMTFAKSPTGQKMISEAQRRAKDPATRAQVQQMAAKVRSKRSGGAPER